MQRQIDHLVGATGAAVLVGLLTACAGPASVSPARDGAASDTTSPAQSAAAADRDASRSPAPSLPVVPASSPGCANPDLTLAPGSTTTRTVATESGERTYLLYVPIGYDPATPTPAVVTLHGLGTTGFLQMANSGIITSANTHGYLVIAPDGLNRAWEVPTPGTEDASTADAVFIDDVITDVGGALCVDPSRQYASGFSMGSIMTLVLACQPERTFAAFGGVGAAFYEPVCDAALPAPLIYFHGTADDVVPFDGGTARGFTVDPVPEVMAAWANHNACTVGPTESVTADITLAQWSSCELNADVDFYRVDDGGHTWPGSPVTTNPAFADFAGATTSTVNATEAMWEFFSDYSLPTG